MLLRLTTVTLVTMWVVMIVFGREPGEVGNGTLGMAANAGAEAPQVLEETAAIAREIPTEDTRTEIVLASAGVPDAEIMKSFFGPTPAPAAKRETVARAETIDLAKPAPAAKPVPVTLYVTGDRVNFRDGPSTRDAVIGQLGKGHAVELLSETENGWMEIRDPQTGATGFMAGWLLTTEKSG